MSIMTGIAFGGIMKDILILSHCILNNAAKVEQDETELESEYVLRDELMQLILANRIQVLQLPCPELMIYGSRRWGHVRNQFDNPFFRKSCMELLEPVLLQLEEYASRSEAFNVIGVVSVEGSPSCGYKLTCTGDWKGEIGTDIDRIKGIICGLEMKESSGVFMELLEEELRKRALDIPIVTMEEAIEIIRIKG